MHDGGGMTESSVSSDCKTFLWLKEGSPSVSHTPGTNTLADASPSAHVGSAEKAGSPEVTTSRHAQLLVTDTTGEMPPPTALPRDGMELRDTVHSPEGYRDTSSLGVPAEVGEAIAYAPPELQSRVTVLLRSLFTPSVRAETGGEPEVYSGVRLFDESNRLPPPQYTEE